jgi:hypothetical protein
MGTLAEYEKAKYEKAIAARLQPLRVILAPDNIPVASLPKEAAKFTEKYSGSIRILVGHSYRGKQSAFTGQKREIDCSIYIRLANRFDDELPPARDPAVEWVESEINRLLLGWVLPAATTPLLSVNARLMAPEEGEWQKEINFTFTDFVLFDEEDEDDTIVGATVFDVDFKTE